MWWRGAVFYHLYVRSFQDSNGDGIGDLPGLLQRLPVLVDLGVDAIWLSPIYPSPQADLGYDVADYRGVDPVYGNLSDLARLRDELHHRGMRLVLDFVPNHTSVEHPWFVEACRDRGAVERHWYIWRDPAPDGGPPNNWCGIFGGPAWSLHEPTGQYYLHSFLPEQPDLNWRHPDLVRAMHDHLRFWLAWGVDGFRVDAIPHVVKDKALRSNPASAGYTVPPGDPCFDPFSAQAHIYDRMQPEVFDVVRGLRRVLDEYDDRVLIGETATDEVDEYLSFFGEGRFDLGFCFSFLRARSLGQVREAVQELYASLPAHVWPTLVLSNHDVGRHLSRFSAAPSDALAKAASAALLLSRGTPFVYYGEEIGMPNTPVPPELLCDPAGIFERDHQRRLFFSDGYESFGRDPERTPMPWDAGGGFSTGTPWLPLGDTTARNVARQRADPGSVWHWYRSLLHLRRSRACLREGTHEPLPGDRGGGQSAGVWGFAREGDGERLVIVINCDAGATALPAAVNGLSVVIGTERHAGDRLPEDGGTLAGYEVVVATGT